MKKQKSKELDARQRDMAADYWSKGVNSADIAHKIGADETEVVKFIHHRQNMFLAARGRAS